MSYRAAGESSTTGGGAPTLCDRARLEEGSDECGTAGRLQVQMAYLGKDRGPVLISPARCSPHYSPCARLSPPSPPASACLTVIPVPESASPACLNDYPPVALRMLWEADYRITSVPSSRRKWLSCHSGPRQTSSSQMSPNQRS